MRLTKPLDVAPTDQCTSEVEERLVDIISPLVAHLEAPIAVQPRQRPLHHPPVPAQPLARVDTPPSDARLDPSLSQGRPLGSGRSPSPCQRAVSRGTCAACRADPAARGSAGSRPSSPPASSSRGRWPLTALPPAGCRLGLPQDGALSPACPYPSDSAQPFRPPGGWHRRRVQGRARPVDLVRFPQAVQQRSVQALPQADLVPLL